MKRLIALTATTLVVVVTLSHGQTCNDYSVNFPGPAQVGLFATLTGEAVQSSGDIVYWFDGNGHLDALSLQNPSTFQLTHYQPPINIQPYPTRLLKLGDDRLYAYHVDAQTQAKVVSIIDIDPPVPPTLVATVPAFGDGEILLGYWDGYAYFLDDYSSSAHILTYDLTDPDTPSFVGSTVVGLPSMFGGIFGEGYMYFHNGYDFWIFDTNNGAPTLASQLTIDDINIAEEMGGPMWYDDARLYSTSYNSSTKYIVSLEDPLNPISIGTMSAVPYIVEHNYMYGYKLTGTTFLTHHFGVLNSAGSPLGWAQWGSYPQNAYNFTLTDNALVYTRGTNFVYALPRQCDPPVINANSVAMTRTPGPGIKETWTFTWVTDGWTDPQFDAVTITPSSKNPPLCQTTGLSPIGTGTVVRRTQGGWQHTKKYSWSECVTGCQYTYKVSSQRTGIPATSATKFVKVMYCFGGGPVSEATPEPGGLRLTSSPNPFNPSTQIRFFNPGGTTHARLAVYDVSGRLVRTVHDANVSHGWHTVEWNGDDDNGARSSSGIYFAALDAGANRIVKKLLMLK